MLRIPAELENGHKDRLLPMASEFSTCWRPCLNPKEAASCFTWSGTTLSYYVRPNAERTAAILWHEREKAAAQEPPQQANQPSTDGRF